VGRQTLRLLHLADLHLGVHTGGRPDPSTGLNQRVVDVCERFDEVCAVAEAEGVHAVLFAGDAFNNQHPNPTLQSLFAERVRRLTRSGCAVFLLIGNHDLPKRRSLEHPFSIYDALEVEGVVVGDRAHAYRLPLNDAPASELQIGALPHFSRSNILAKVEGDVEDPKAYIEERVAEAVKSIGASIDPALPSVFVGHCHVNQADLGDGQTRFDVSEIELPLSTLTSGQPYPYFALGHIHTRQVLSEDPFVAYPGSLERFDYGEGEKVDVRPEGSQTVREPEPKGFYRLDLVDDGGWRLASPPEFRTVGARRFVTLRLGELAPVDPVADVGERVQRVRAAGVEMTDAFVRIAGTISAADRGRVTAASVRTLVPEAYDVTLALETQTSTMVRDPRFAQRMSEARALDSYLETRNDDWGDEVDELRKLGRELISEVLDT
jgi:exonuclease SbcD